MIKRRPGYKVIATLPEGEWQLSPFTRDGRVFIVAACPGHEPRVVFPDGSVEIVKSGAGQTFD